MSHWLSDVLPFYSCCLWQEEQSVGCQRYRFERRASQDCVGYQPPGGGQSTSNDFFVPSRFLICQWNCEPELLQKLVSSLVLDCFHLKAHSNQANTVTCGFQVITNNCHCTAVETGTNTLGHCISQQIVSCLNQVMALRIGCNSELQENQGNDGIVEQCFKCTENETDKWLDNHLLLNSLPCLH